MNNYANLTFKCWNVFIWFPLLQNIAYKRIGHRLSIYLIIDVILLIKQNIKLREGLNSRGRSHRSTEKE